MHDASESEPICELSDRQEHDAREPPCASDDQGHPGAQREASLRIPGERNENRESGTCEHSREEDQCARRLVLREKQICDQNRNTEEESAENERERTPFAGQHAERERTRGGARAEQHRVQPAEREFVSEAHQPGREQVLKGGGSRVQHESGHHQRGKTPRRFRGGAFRLLLRLRGRGAVHRQLDVRKPQGENDKHGRDQQEIESFESESADEQGADPGTDRASEEAACHECGGRDAGCDFGDVLRSAQSERMNDCNARSDDDHQQADQEEGGRFGQGGEEDDQAGHDQPERQQTGRAAVTVEQGRGDLHHVAPDAHAGENHDAESEIQFEIGEGDGQHARKRSAEKVHHEVRHGKCENPGSRLMNGRRNDAVFFHFAEILVSSV